MPLSGIIHRIAGRWKGEGGYRELWIMALPLILSTGSWSIQHFVDRMFLAWYSPEAIAAVMPSGILNFTTMSIFIGTASYASIFVAQYYGAGKLDRVGPSCWQGVYVALIGGAVHALLIPLAAPFFAFVGHEPVVQKYEVIYFQILCMGALPVIASSAFSGFFTGLGRPWPVMWINVMATAVNLLFDYLLIFGKWGFPEMGIKGAAIATLMSGCANCAAYLVLLAGSPDKGIFGIITGWRFDRELFGRLIRFGLPSGVQFFVDIAGFTIFILLVGRLGTIRLAATNIAFNINTLAFMPMIGFGIAVSVLVGQYLGKERPDLGERSVYSGFHLTFIYMTSIAALYFFVPGLFIEPFTSGADTPAFAEIRSTAMVLLRFVALYSVFDTMNVIFASALKGAGDTKYVMYMLLAVSLLVLVFPSFAVIVMFRGSLNAAWVIASAYVIILGFSFFLRFLGGKWKKMKVIEECVVCLPPSMPEAPVPE